MKRVLITGANGFLGREFTSYFRKEYDVFSLSRDQLDVTNEVEVKTFLDTNVVDIVLHTAFSGVSNPKVSIRDAISNLKAYENLSKHLRSDQKLFCFGSGSAKEGSKTKASVGYTTVKRLISQDILERKKENVFDFTLYGCFGVEEDTSRFIKSSIRNSNNSEPIIINNNIFMDFFFVEDVCKVIERYTQPDSCTLPKSFDLVYKVKVTLLEIAKIISDNEYLITIIDPEGIPYVGDSSTLDDIGLSLVGLEKGIEKVKCLI